jgi:hypothetical protein
MSYEIYKDYVIIASASQDEATGEWRPVASVSWQSPAQKRRGIHLFSDLPDRYATFDEATSFAMATAKNWIDRHQGGLD